MEFLGNEVHWKQFKKKLIQEGADIGDIIEVFEHYDTDKDFILTREEISIMKSHVTVHHDLTNPREHRYYTFLGVSLRSPKAYDPPNDR